MMTYKDLTSGLLISILTFFSFHLLADYGAAENKMRNSDCLSCHTKSQRLVGPSFSDIAAKYEANESNIASLVKAIKNGGSGKWGVIPMTPHPNLSDRQIREMVEGILSLTGEVAETKATQEAAIKKATEEDIQRGSALFQGNIRFKNKGATCISCHHVKNDAVIGGGILAKDLTTVFSRLGEPGVTAILGSAPFPVMEQAYRNNPLTEDEIFSIVAFLHFADENHAYQHPKDYGVGLFFSGIGGAALIFFFFFLVGRGRKKDTVYKKIFDRQMKSQ